MRKFVSIGVLIGILLTGCNSSTENGSSDKTEDSESYTVPSEFGPVVTGLFNRYIAVKTPNDGTIHIFSQSGVSVAQLLKARNTLQFFLTDTMAMNKDVIADSMANRNAALFIFDDEDAMEEVANNDDITSDPIFDNMQVLYGTEIFVEGDRNYLAESSNRRDATFEEVLHITQAQGIAPAMPKFQNIIAKETNLAIEGGVWNPTQNQLDDWEFEGDEITGYTTSHEYFATIVEAYYGMWEHKNTGMDGYIANSRESQAEMDEKGLAIVHEFLPEYITTMMDIDASFAAGRTFHLSRDKDLPYTAKSQYLTSVRLTGTNDSNIVGNAQDNILMGNQGDNNIDGKAGRNTYKVNGLRADFDVEHHGDGYLIQDRVNARNGSDTLTNIQTIEFNDIKLNLSKR
ncbi:hypothetical protein HWV00_07110 [Moritella sp. 24]|uniref:hypothetical protein n=1 Tax=Moritella sp. 24 TaxID=2746230 RepID=UPI001BA5DFB5|nr:hypothetical protein [Moritella sp. 24]QUM76010.1 hypothetical protein HWV00_07110 [Moritella sp. 24]